MFSWNNHDVSCKRIISPPKKRLVSSKRSLLVADFLLEVNNAEALVETGTATEVNAGIYYRYPVKEMCPGSDFVKILVEHGVEFTVSSDSHYPDDLGKFTEMNADMLKSLGIQKLVGFDKRIKRYHSL